VLVQITGTLPFPEKLRGGSLCSDGGLKLASTDKVTDAARHTCERDVKE